MPGIWASQRTESYPLSFVDADLTAGVLTVTHNLGITGPPNVVVFDNNGNEITPDEITKVDNNSCTVDLSTFGTLTPTWSLSVTG